MMPKANPKKKQVLEKIKLEYDHFTPAQKAIAEFIIHNPESLLFMSISEMAEKAQVSTASIVRFCNVLGFDGYTQLIKEGQQAIQSQLSTLGRFNITHNLRSTQILKESKSWGDSAFSRILSHEIENLDRLAVTIKVEDFNKAAELIEKADRILVIGCMASASLAAHMGRMLCKVIPEVDVADSDGVLDSAKFLRLTSRSVAFVIAFPRYPSVTVRLATTALESGCHIVSITDSHLSAISGLGELTFHIRVGIPSFVDAYAAPLTFINALCAEVAEKNPSRSKSALTEYDDLASKINLFDKQVWRGRPRKED
jgi:DNA-binding MurR/RpiR family transcriptional regulator